MTLPQEINKGYLQSKTSKPVFIKIGVYCSQLFNQYTQQYLPSYALHHHKTQEWSLSSPSQPVEFEALCNHNQPNSP